jgi:hypothetical protein
MESINQAAKHLATLLPEEALDPSNPSFDANVRRLFHDAERAIHTLPSEYWEGVGVRPLTADYMVENRTQTAEPVYPSLRERLTTGGGVPITRLSDASEIAEQLGFPSDEAHTKHIQSYLDTIPDDDVHFIQSNHNLIKEHGDVMGIDSSMYDSHLDDHLKEQHGHGAGAGDAPLQAEMRNLKSMRSRMEKDIREWDLTSGKRLLEIQARLEELEPLVEKESEIRGFDALHSRAARHLEGTHPTPSRHWMQSATAYPRFAATWGTAGNCTVTARPSKGYSTETGGSSMPPSASAGFKRRWTEIRTAPLS